MTRSVARALTILHLFTVGEAEISLSEVSRRAALHQSTVTRINALPEDLEKVRQQGFAVDDEEHEVSVACVAAPVFDSSRMVAAISASGPADRIRQEMRNRDLTQAVIAAAAETSAKPGRVAALPATGAPAPTAAAGRKRATRARK